MTIEQELADMTWELDLDEAVAIGYPDDDVRGEDPTSRPLPGKPENVPPAAKTHRGTTNRNDRGSSAERARRRAWLVETYRADVDVVTSAQFGLGGDVLVPVIVGTEGAQPACRCYRCGLLLTADTLTVDRIKPGCQGGTYARNNIRPACGRCNAVTGATTRRK